MRISLLLAFILCTACAQRPERIEPAASSVGPVIVKVVSRDSVITARAGTNGPVYAVSNAAGQAVAPPMTLEDLQAAEPQLARHIHSMQADRSTGAWAGLD